MATHTRSTSISEDWEELRPISGEDSIYDDTASIISLSTSVAESEDINDTDEIVPANTSTPSTPPPPAYVPLPADTSFSRDYDDSRSVNSVDTVTGDLLDVDIDPPILLSTLCSLQSTVDEIITSSAGLYTLLSRKSIETVEIALQTLHTTLSEVKDVVGCYAQLWNPKHSMIPPLDPALYKWCTDCAIMLLGLQAELESAALSLSRHGEGEPYEHWAGEPDIPPSGHGYIDSLNGFCENMVAFLPIMKADLNEYQAPQLSFPTYAPPNLTSRSHRITDPLPMLRRQLYALKDEIEKTNGIINDCQTAKVFSKRGAEAATKIQASQMYISREMSVLLSNHGGDWIDQALAGGLSFAEFNNLDLSSISDFQSEFRKFGHELENQRRAKCYGLDTGENAGSSNKRNSCLAQRFEKARRNVVEKMKKDKSEIEWDQFEHMQSVVKRLNTLLKVKVDNAVDEEKEDDESSEGEKKDVVDSDEDISVIDMEEDNEVSD